MAAAQFGWIEAGAGGSAGYEVLDEDVGARNHAVQQRLVLLGLEVKHDRFLTAVEPDEIGAFAMYGSVIAAGDIALRALDLADARAGIGEPARAERGRDRPLQADDQNAVKPRHQ